MDTKMATMRSKREARDLVECPICKDAFKTPKCLPCIHTFCLECLEKYGKDERPGDEMACPICQLIFKIPLGGFEKLPNNFFIDQISISFRSLPSIDESLSSGLKCEGCQARDAIKYCAECAQSMCDACSLPHGKLRASQSHKVVSLTEKEGSTVYLRVRPTYCDTHKDKQLELYCYDCSQAICSLCIVEGHRLHYCEDIQTASKKFIDELQGGYPQLNESIENIIVEQKSLEANKESLLEQISACQSAINDRGTEIKRLVDEQCSELFSKLEKFRNEESKKIQTRKDEVDHELLMLSSLRAYVEELVEKGSACAISQIAKDLLNRAKRLHADQVEFSKGSLSPDRVEFEPANIADITSGRMALIGSLSINGGCMQHVQSTLGELESNLSETRQQLTRLNERVLSLQASNKQLTQQAQADKARHEAELTKIQEMHSVEVKAANVKWDQALTSLKDQLQKAGNEMTHLKEQMGNVEMDRANLAQKLNKAETETTSLKEKLNKAETETKSLKEKLSKADTGTNSLKEKLSKVDTETKSLKEKLSKAETETKSLKEKLSNAETETESLNKKQNKADKDTAIIVKEVLVAGKRNTELDQTLRSCGIESFLIIVGLSDGGKTSQRFCHISLERPDSVSTIDSTPACVDDGATACVMGNTLYAVGIGSAYNELWKWNAASDWTRCADMTSGRSYHCAAVVDSTLYALGGSVDGTSVEAYNTQEKKWSAAGQLTHAVDSAACVSYNNSIYTFGGVDANGRVVAHVQMYNATKHECTLLHNAMPRAYDGMRAVVWETYAILVGRYTCFIYNFKSETWQERASFKTDVQFFALVVDNQTLYIAGGGSSKMNKRNESICTCTAEVRSVSVCDVIEDKQGARWTHHATLPQRARVHAFSPVPLRHASTQLP